MCAPVALCLLATNYRVVTTYTIVIPTQRGSTRGIIPLPTMEALRPRTPMDGVPAPCAPRGLRLLRALVRPLRAR